MMSENGNLSAADIAAVVDGRGGYGYGGYAMPYAVPMYGGSGFGSGFGGFGGDWSWIIILFLFAMMGGWGGNGGFGNQQFPWMLANNTDNLVTSGFNNSNVTSLLGDLQNQITSGFASAEVADCNRAMDAMQTAYTNQIAGMNQRFADTTALNAQLNNLSAGLQNCCCENRASIADLKYTVATEACADRATVNEALRDVIEANTASTQRILDQMCQDKIDAKNDEIAQLRQEILFARGQASQIAQNQTIVDNIYNRLDTCPVGTTPVYGRTPIFTCNNNSGCGCMGGFNGNF